MVGGQLYGIQLHGHGGACNARVKPWLLGIAPPSPATPTTESKSQHTHLNLLITIVPFVRDESVQIVGTLFCAETANFASWSQPNGALFWGLTRTWNLDTRPLSDSFWRHEFNDSIKFNKRAFVENHVFRGSKMWKWSSRAVVNARRAVWATQIL